MSGEIKINRIKSANAGQLKLLGEVTRTAQEVVPKLRSAAENRVAFQNMEESMSALGAYCRKKGFDPTRTFQHVANYDNEVWLLVLKMFAKTDDDGQLIDDGLLYKTNPETGSVQLQRDFFYAILSYLSSCGVPCDMRGKIQLH